MSYIKDKVQTILTTATIKGLELHQLPHAQRIFYISAGNISKENTMTEQKQAPQQYDAGPDWSLRRFRSRPQASTEGYVYRVYLGVEFAHLVWGNCG